MYTVENAKVVPLVRSSETGRARGSLIQQHVDWLREYGSRDEIISLFESLNPSLRHQVTAAQPAQWYHFGVVVELQLAIASHFACGDERFIEKIGAHAAQRQIAPLREYTDLRRIHDFFRTTAVLHRDSLDFGSSDYMSLGEDNGTMVVTGLASAPSHRAYLMGFYRETIIQHGGRDATTREGAPGMFDMCWR